MEWGFAHESKNLKWNGGFAHEFKNSEWEFANKFLQLEMEKGTCLYVFQLQMEWEFSHKQIFHELFTCPSKF